MNILHTVSKQYFINVLRGNALKFDRFRCMSSGIKYGDLINDDVTSSFLLPLNSDMARIDYEKKNGTLNLHSTSVPENYQNQGIAEILAKEVFDYCSKRNLKIKLSCDYLQKFYNRNPRPEYEAIVVE